MEEKSNCYFLLRRCATVKKKKTDYLDKIIADVWSIQSLFNWLYLDLRSSSRYFLAMFKTGPYNRMQYVTKKETIYDLLRRYLKASPGTQGIALYFTSCNIPHCKWHKGSLQQPINSYLPFYDSSSILKP